MKFRHILFSETWEQRGKKPHWGKWQGAGFTGKELQSKWQETRMLACDLLQSHHSFLCLLVQEGGLAAGGDRHTWGRTQEGFSGRPQGLAHGPIFLILSVFSFAQSHSLSQKWPVAPNCFRNQLKRHITSVELIARLVTLFPLLFCSHNFGGPRRPLQIPIYLLFSVHEFFLASNLCSCLASHMKFSDGPSNQFLVWKMITWRPPWSSDNPCFSRYSW